MTTAPAPLMLTIPSPSPKIEAHVSGLIYCPEANHILLLKRGAEDGPGTWEVGVTGPMYRGMLPTVNLYMHLDRSVFDGKTSLPDLEILVLNTLCVPYVHDWSRQGEIPGFRFLVTVKPKAMSWVSVAGPYTDHVWRPVHEQPKDLILEAEWRDGMDILTLWQALWAYNQLEVA